MRVAVFGTGAVGAYYGGRFAQSGVEVSFVARGQHLQAIREQGLKIDSIKGDFTVTPKQATDDCAEIGEVDLVLVCVKGWQVSEGLTQMAHLVGEHTVLLPLLNGVDAVALLNEKFGSHKVLNGLCGIFAKLSGPGHVAHMGAEPWLQFGEQDNGMTDRAQQVLALLQRTEGFSSKLVENISTAVWRKFIFIASTSGVGSICRANFGEVRANPHTEQLLSAVVDEIISVAKAHEVPLPEDVKALIWQQICRSSDKSDTSMQRDVLMGKPSELESQTGAVIRLGKQVGVATPLNDMIYAALLPQEKRARG